MNLIKSELQNIDHHLIELSFSPEDCKVQEGNISITCYFIVGILGIGKGSNAFSLIVKNRTNPILLRESEE